MKTPGSSRPVTSRTGLAGRLDDLVAGREDVLDGPARHQLDQLARRRLVDGEAGGDGAAVLEDGDPVADLADLLEPVRDVDDGDALGGEVADDAEQVVDLALVEHGGRLVQDEQPGVVGEGARHADDLLRGGREPADRAGRLDLGVPEPGEQLARTADRLPALAEAGGAELVAEEDVLGDAEVGDEVELLVDRGDPEVHRGLRRRQRDRLALPQDLALVGLVARGEDLDQGRLAGAVLAEQAVHLPRAHLELDPSEREHSGEPLDDAAHGEQRGVVHDITSSVGTARGTSVGSS